MPGYLMLEVIREFLAARITGVTITSVVVRRPLIVRNLLGGEFSQTPGQAALPPSSGAASSCSGA
jgi:hypothetical protein